MQESSALDKNECFQDHLWIHQQEQLKTSLTRYLATKLHLPTFAFSPVQLEYRFDHIVADVKYTQVATPFSQFLRSFQ
jgi:hypothetical protein